MTNLRFYPNKTAYIAMRAWSSLVRLVVIAVVAVVLSLLVSNQFLWLIAAIFVITALEIINTYVSFNKQSYLLSKGQINYNDGHLLADRKTELKFSNVTHVRVIKPFIEYHLFGTGKLIIESAGSSSATVEFKSIKRPYEAFEEVRAQLAEQTFALSYAKLLSQKQPSPLAVILQMLGIGAAAVYFVVFTFGLGLVATIATSLNFAWLLALLLIALVGILVAFYVAYQDQLRRVYSVYSDVIHYSKGYLTRQEAFMPAANLANSELTQNFIGKLFNLQDVVVSCQGQASEINFANLRQGEQLQQAVNQLINHRQDLKLADSKTITAAAKAESAIEQAAGRFTAPPTPSLADTSTHDFYMNLWRPMVPFWPLIILLPIWLVIFVTNYITVKRTVFRLTDGGVASYFSFLSTKNTEFSRDKITGLVIKRNFIDLYMNTCTVSFWSIGSGRAVDFKHIDYNDNLPELMRVKAGIVSDEELSLVKPQFSFVSSIKANLGLSLGLILVGLSLFSLAVVITWWFMVPLFLFATAIVIAYFILRRRYTQASLRLGQHTTSVQIGVLFHQHFYALNDNIKDLSLLSYPSSNLGDVTFNVAGERTVDDGQGHKRQITNKFSLAYLPHIASEISGKQAWLDHVLLAKPTRKQFQQIITKAKPAEVLSLGRPALKNSFIPLILLHVIVFPLLLILPISLALRRYWLRRVSYCLEGDRVIKRWGVIYRKQDSIVLPKLDYTETGQQLLNKLCKNGNIYFYTAGSSRVELTFTNMANYKQFYEQLKQQ